MQKAVHSGLPFVVQKNENMEVYYGRRKNRKTKSTGNHRQYRYDPYQVDQLILPKHGRLPEIHQRVEGAQHSSVL